MFQKLKSSLVDTSSNAAQSVENYIYLLPLEQACYTCCKQFISLVLRSNVAQVAAVVLAVAWRSPSMKLVMTLAKKGRRAYEPQLIADPRVKKGMSA